MSVVSIPGVKTLRVSEIGEATTVVTGSDVTSVSCLGSDEVIRRKSGVEVSLKELCHTKLS